MFIHRLNSLFRWGFPFYFSDRLRFDCSNRIVGLRKVGNDRRNLPRMGTDRWLLLQFAMGLLLHFELKIGFDLNRLFHILFLSFALSLFFAFGLCRRKDGPCKLDKTLLLLWGWNNALFTLFRWNSVFFIQTLFLSFKLFVDCFDFGLFLHLFICCLMFFFFFGNRLFWSLLFLYRRCGADFPFFVNRWGGFGHKTLPWFWHLFFYCSDLINFCMNGVFVFLNKGGFCLLFLCVLWLWFVLKIGFDVEYIFGLFFLGFCLCLFLGFCFGIDGNGLRHTEDVLCLCLD